MSYFEDQRVAARRALVSRRIFAFAAWRAAAQRWLFQRRAGAACPNERLRRDAGIDDDRHQFETARKAPFIR
jgi:hypothetical protein